MAYNACYASNICPLRQARISCSCVEGVEDEVYFPHLEVLAGYERRYRCRCCGIRKNSNSGRGGKVTLSQSWRSGKKVCRKAECVPESRLGLGAQPSAPRPGTLVRASLGCISLSSLRLPPLWSGARLWACSWVCIVNLARRPTERYPRKMRSAGR